MSAPHEVWTHTDGSGSIPWESPVKTTRYLRADIVDALIAASKRGSAALWELGANAAARELDAAVAAINGDEK